MPRGFAVRSWVAVAIAAGSCLIAVLAAPASADPAAGGRPAQTGPTVAVSPSTGLVDGQTVTVTGTGFTPNQSIGVSQCRDPFVDSSSCDFATAEITTSDGSGAFTMQYTVRATIQGDYSCVPTGCLIGSSNLQTQNEFGNQVSISFDDGSTDTTAPSTETTAAASPSTTIAGTDDELPRTGASDSLPYVAGVGALLLVLGVGVKRANSRRTS